MTVPFGYGLFLSMPSARRGPERRRLRELLESDREIGISSIAWYEFSRGPRTPEQLAVTRALFADDGVVPFSEGIAAAAAEVFRRLGLPPPPYRRYRNWNDGCFGWRDACFPECPGLRGDPRAGNRRR